jgi:hypothetical protein
MSGFSRANKNPGSLPFLDGVVGSVKGEFYNVNDVAGP